MRFSENLRELRKDKDYSQEYLAEKLGVTRQTVSKWENATAMPDLKKLTEIADFFGVSMDTLLGMEPESTDKNEMQSDTNNSNNENNYNAEYQKQYTEQLFSMAYQNQYEQNLANHKTLKTLCIIFAVIIAVIIFSMIILYDSFESRLSTLQNQINQLSFINTPQYYDDNSSENGFEYKFLSVDKEKNYMIHTQFTYLPSTYPKNAAVYLIIDNSDGTSQRIDMTEENSSFTATADIDVTIAESGYVYIDDGEVITREELFYGFDVGSFIYFEYGNIYDKKYDQYSVDFTTVKWQSGSDITPQITNAYLIGEKDGKELYNKELEINSYTDEDGFVYSKVRDTEIESLSTPTTMAVYLKLVDENGLIYKYNLVTETTEIVFSDEKTMSNNSY